MTATKRQAKPLRFIELDTGCYVPVSHKTNQDGYFRKAWGNERSGDRRAEMFHRIIWKMHKGDIPEDYEIDHQCKNRACQNVDHMRCISGHEHTVHTNRTRWL